MSQGRMLLGALARNQIPLYVAAGHSGLHPVLLAKMLKGTRPIQPEVVARLKDLIARAEADAR